MDADRAPKSELDRLLAMLEADTEATIILLAEDRSKVPPAIQSRCDRLAVMPLHPAAAVDRLRAICERESVPCAHKALEVISLQAKHGAGAIFHALWRVAKDGNVSLKRARETFGLGWPRAARLALLALIDEEESVALARLGELSPSVPEALHRLRVYLAYLRPFCDTSFATARPPIDPALLFRNRTEFGLVIDRLQARSAESQTRVVDFWTIVAAFWSACDAGDAVGLAQAVRLFRRALSTPIQQPASGQ